MDWLPKSGSLQTPDTILVKLASKSTDILFGSSVQRKTSAWFELQLRCTLQLNFVSETLLHFDCEILTPYFD